MLQDRGRYEPSRRNYGSDNSRAPIDNEVVVHEMQLCSDRLNEDKAAGKQKAVDTKEVPKATNIYARPTLGKCFKCNHQVTDLAAVPLGGSYTWFRGKKRKRTKFVVSQMELERRKRITRMMLRGRIMWLGN